MDKTEILCRDFFVLKRKTETVMESKRRKRRLRTLM